MQCNHAVHIARVMTSVRVIMVTILKHSGAKYALDFQCEYDQPI